MDEKENTDQKTQAKKSLLSRIGNVVAILIGVLIALILVVKALINGGVFDERIKSYALDRFRIQVDYDRVNWSIPFSFKVFKPSVVAAEAGGSAAPIACDQVKVRLARSGGEWSISDLEVTGLEISLELNDEWQVQRLPGDLQFAFPDLIKEGQDDEQTAELKALPALGVIGALHMFQKLGVTDSEITIGLPEAREITVTDIQVESKTEDEILVGTMTATVRAARTDLMTRLELHEDDIRFAVAEGKSLRMDSHLAIADGKMAVRVTANECVLSKYRELAQFAGLDMPRADGALYGTCAGELNLFDVFLNRGTVKMNPAMSVVKGSLVIPDSGTLKAAALNLEGNIEYSLPDGRIQWSGIRLDTSELEIIHSDRIIHLKKTDTQSKSGEYRGGSWKAELQSQIKMGELDISVSCLPAAEGETLKIHTLNAACPGVGKVEAELTISEFKRLTHGQISLTNFFPHDAIERIAQSVPLPAAMTKLPAFIPEGELSIHADLKNLPVTSNDWLADLRSLSSKADIKSSFLHTEGRYDGRAKLDFSNEALEIEAFEIQTPIGNLQIQGSLSSTLNEIKEGTIQFADIAPGDYAKELSLPKELEEILVASTGSGHLKFVNTSLPLDVLVVTPDRPFPFRNLIERCVIEGSLELTGPESLKTEIVFEGKEDELVLKKFMLDWRGLGRLVLTGSVKRDLETLTSGSAKLSGASVPRIQELFGSLAPEMRMLELKGGLDIVTEVHDFPLIIRGKAQKAEATFSVSFDKPVLSLNKQDFSFSASSKRWQAKGKAQTVLGKSGYRISDLSTRLSCENTSLVSGKRSFKSTRGTTDISATEAGEGRYSINSTWSIDIDQETHTGSIKVHASPDRIIDMEQAVLEWDKVVRLEAKAKRIDLKLLTESLQNAGRAFQSAAADLRVLDIGKLQSYVSEHLPQDFKAFQTKGGLELSLLADNAPADGVPKLMLTVSTAGAAASGIIKPLREVTGDSPVAFTLKGEAELSCIPDWSERSFREIQYSLTGLHLGAAIPIEEETIHTSINCELSNKSIQISEASIRWPSGVAAVLKASAARFGESPKNDRTGPPAASFTLGKDIPLADFIGFTQLNPVTFELQNIDIAELTKLTRPFVSGLLDEYTPSGKLKLSFKTGPGMLIGKELAVLQPPDGVTLLLEMREAGLLPIDENRVEGIENLNLDLKATLSRSKVRGETAVDLDADIKADSFSAYRDLFFLDFTSRKVGLGLKGHFFSPSHFEIGEGKLSLSDAFQIGVSELSARNVGKLWSQISGPVRDGDQRERASFKTRLSIDVSNNDQLLTDLRESFGESLHLLNLLELTGNTSIETEIQAGHGEVRTWGRFEVNEADASYGQTHLEGLNASIPFDLGWPRDPPKPSTPLPFGKVSVETLTSGIVFFEDLGLSLKLEENRLYTEEVDQLFYGGSLKISPIMTNSLLSDDIKAEGNLKVEGMQIQRLLQSLLLQDLKGVAHVDLKNIRLGGKDLSLEGNANLHVFDGSIEVTNLAVKDLFSNLSRLELDLVAKDLSLEEATNVIPAGEMTGILAGHIKGLKLDLSTRQPIQFDSSFRTVKRRGVPQYITADAVKTLSGAEKLAAEFYNIEGKHRYKAFGFDASLKNDLIHIKGVDQKDGREEILSPALFSRVKYSVRFPQEIRYQDFESGVIRAYESVLDAIAEDGSKPDVEVK